MKILESFQKELFKILLNNCNAKIFSDVPKNSKYPIIKIGEFELTNWLIPNESFILETDIVCYSSYTSNSECLNLVTSIFHSISLIPATFDKYQILKKELSKVEIIQNKSGIWVGTVSTKFYISFKNKVN